MTIFALACGLIAADAPGQGHLWVTDPQTGSRVRLAIARHHAQVIVRPPTALVQLDQAFFNPHDRQEEGEFVFALPPGAAVSRFAMYTTPSTLIEGEIVRRDRARQIYDSIVRTKRDPAILEQIGPELFRMRVFPIPPKDVKRILLDYTVPLSSGDAGLSFKLPLVTDLEPIADFRLKAVVHAPAQIADRVTSPSHPDIKWQTRKQDGARVFEFGPTAYKPTGDFRIALPSNPTPQLTVYHGKASEDQYFTLQLPAETFPRLPTDAVFMLDTSYLPGAVDERKYWIRLLDRAVRGMKKGDRVLIAGVDCGFRRLHKGWLDIGTPSVDAALAELERQFGLGDFTGDPLLEAVTAYDELGPATETRRRITLFAGHGQLTAPLNEKAPPVADYAARLAKAFDRAQVDFITLGVDRGREGEVTWADIIHSQNDGFAWEGLPRGFDEARFDRWTSLGCPTPRRIVDCALAGTLRSPIPLPLLWHSGEPLLFAGKSTEALKGKLDFQWRQRGLRGDRAIDFPAAIVSPDAFVARQWAKREIERLRWSAAREPHGDRLLPVGGDERMVALAQEWSLLTHDTAFLVLETEADYARYGIDRSKRRRYWQPADALPADPPWKGLAKKLEAKKAVARVSTNFDGKQWLATQNRRRGWFSETNLSLPRPNLLPETWYGRAGLIPPSFLRRNPHATALMKTVAPPSKQMNLAEFADWLTRSLGVPVGFDDEGLKSAMLDRSSVRFDFFGLKSMSGRNLIRHALPPIGLQAHDRDDGIVISDESTTNKALRQRVIAAADVLRNELPAHPGELFDPYEEFDDASVAGIAAQLDRPLPKKIPAGKTADQLAALLAMFDANVLFAKQLSADQLEIMNDAYELTTIDGPRTFRRTLEDIIPATTLRHAVAVPEAALLTDGEELRKSNVVRSHSTKSVEAVRMLEVDQWPEGAPYLWRPNDELRLPIVDDLRAANSRAFGLADEPRGGGFGGGGFGGGGGLGGFGGGLGGGLGGGNPFDDSDANQRPAPAGSGVVGVFGNSDNTRDKLKSRTDDRGETTPAGAPLGVATASAGQNDVNFGKQPSLRSLRSALPISNQFRLSKLIQDSIDRDVWEANGGDATMIGWFNQTLIVDAPTSTHRKIDVLLAELAAEPDAFVPNAGLPAKTPPKFDERTGVPLGQLVRLLQETVDRDVWEPNGGDASLTAYGPKLTLVATAPTGTLMGVERVLTLLRRSRYAAEFGDRPWEASSPRPSQLAVPGRLLGVEPTAQRTATDSPQSNKLPIAWPNGRVRWRLSAPNRPDNPSEIVEFALHADGWSYVASSLRVTVAGATATVALPSAGLTESGPFVDDVTTLLDEALPWLPHRAGTDVGPLFSVRRAAAAGTTLLTPRGAPERRASIAVTVDENGHPRAWIASLDDKPAVTIRFDPPNAAGISPIIRRFAANGAETHRWELIDFDPKAAPITAEAVRAGMVAPATDADARSLVTAINSKKFGDGVAARDALLKRSDREPFAGYLVLWASAHARKTTLELAPAAEDALGEALARRGANALVRAAAMDERVPNERKRRWLQSIPVERMTLDDYSLLGNVQFVLGAFADAERAYAAACALDAGPDIWRRRIQSLARLGRVPDAVELIQAKAATAFDEAKLRACLFGLAEGGARLAARELAASLTKRPRRDAADETRWLSMRAAFEQERYRKAEILAPALALDVSRMRRAVYATVLSGVRDANAPRDAAWIERIVAPIAPGYDRAYLRFAHAERVRLNDRSRTIPLLLAVVAELDLAGRQAAGNRLNDSEAEQESDELRARVISRLRQAEADDTVVALVEEDLRRRRVRFVETVSDLAISYGRAARAKDARRAQATAAHSESFDDPNRRAAGPANSSKLRVDDDSSDELR